MRLRTVFAWYDFWVGFYWSRKDRTLYMFPMPCFGWAFEFPRSASGKGTQALKAPAGESGSLGVYREDRLPSGPDLPPKDPEPKIYKSSDGYHTVIELDGKIYVGDCVVWAEYPSGVSCPTETTQRLYELQKGHKMQQRGKP